MARTPKKVFRGKRAQVVRALQRKLVLLRNMDSRETTSAAFQGTDPDLFIDSARMQAAIARVEDQCSALLALKR